MDIQAFFTAEFEEHADVAARTQAACAESFADLLSRSAESVRHGGKIIFFGNGGSAADCQHLATELTIRYKTDRAPIAAIALTTDTSALTAGGNDLGFENIFSRQIEALGKPGDVAIGISTSGNSENIIRALKAAHALDIVPAALSGKDGGRLVGVADPLIIVPSNTTARIQEMHITLGHLLCGALEQELVLV